MDNFSKWLRSQLNILGWNPSYLADRSTIDRSYICQILSGHIIPGAECCRAIAHALFVSEETVLRQAGHLSPKTYEQTNIDDWVYLLSELPEDDRQELLDIAQVKLNRQNR